MLHLLRSKIYTATSHKRWLTSCTYPALICGKCTHKNDVVTLCIGDSIYNRGLRQPEPWWETQYIATFAQLLAHTYPREDILYVHCQFPNEKLEEELTAPLGKNVRKILSVVHAERHYAVLEMDVEQQTILVCDGLTFDLTTWTAHITNISKRTRLIDIYAGTTY
ncbi:hypothetical protein IV203_001881 [Nitzschia inconspicua]|uniref:Uncharacterized protein n=1 Tax=Nitzschia inconspicua TaxID=303405 RepID=A0A9K3PS10_9STRA|nr:hypothetical protein IV203_001881 [Nitzschia inconspicua]